MTVQPSSSGATVSVESAPEHDEWDDFVTRTAGGDLVQTAAWGRIKRDSGMEVRRLLLRRDGEVLGGAQLIARRLGRLGSVAYLPSGPVIAPHVESDVIASFVEQLLRRATLDRSRALFVQPPEGGERVAAAFRSAGFQPTAIDVAPSATTRIDVQLGAEEILAGMSKHARRDFRQAQRDAFDIRRAERADLSSFQELYRCTAARQGFEPLSLRYLETMWDELHPAGHLEIFIASVDGTDVAGNMVTPFAGLVTGRLLGFDPERLSHRSRPNEALIWAIIEWAADTGAKALDVGGMPRATALEQIAATDPQKMKLRLGGTLVLYPEPLELIPNPALRVAFGAVRSSRFVRTVRNRWRGGAPAEARPINASVRG